MDDCKIEGCPSHIMDIEYSTITNWLSVKVDEGVVFSEDIKMVKTMLELIHSLDSEGILRKETMTSEQKPPTKPKCINGRAHLNGGGKKIDGVLYLVCSRCGKPIRKIN